MAEGQQALRVIDHPLRRKIHVKVPCGACLHTGLCSIEQQIEENLVLEIIEIGRPVEVTLDCSEFVHADFRARPRAGWSADRRAKFVATLARKKAKRA